MWMFHSYRYLGTHALSMPCVLRDHLVPPSCHKDSYEMCSHFILNESMQVNIQYTQTV